GHRGVEATWRVNSDGQRVGLCRDGVVHRGGDVVVGERVDDPVGRRDRDVRLGGAGLNRGQQNGQHGGREKEPGGPRHDLIIAPVYGPSFVEWEHGPTYGAAASEGRGGRDSGAGRALPTTVQRAGAAAPC